LEDSEMFDQAQAIGEATSVVAQVGKAVYEATEMAKRVAKIEGSQSSQEESK
jgi:hypothetical protein